MIVTNAVKDKELNSIDDILHTLEFIELSMNKGDSMFKKRPENFNLHMSEAINMYIIAKHQFKLYK